ncbi:MAG: hypothetical protein RL220_119 [Bacteroidota bacterium]
MSHQRKASIIILALVLFSALQSFAQESDLGSWNILNIRYRMNSSLSFFGETQLRSLQFYDHFHYYEYKGGIQIEMNKQVSAALGLGSYQTYREGGDFVTPKNNDEFRLWPQISFHQSIGKLRVEHRYRSEFRFTSNGYRNRFRLRIGISYPLGKVKDGRQPFQISANNELFFTDKEPFFERNRLLISGQYRPVKTLAFQAGYLHQFDYRINDETGRDFLVLGIYIDLSSGKDEK